MVSVQEVEPLVESGRFGIEDVSSKLSVVGLGGWVFDEESVFLEKEKIELVKLEIFFHESCDVLDESGCFNL
jgi:hypothetical protein